MASPSPQPNPSRHPRSWIVTGAVALGVASLLTSRQSGDDLTTDGAPPLLIVRLTASLLLNGGIWAVLAVWAGWQCRCAVPRRRGHAGWPGAAGWGIAAVELALVVHYLLGWAVGYFACRDVVDNGYWFVAAALVCGPLGVVGWLARGGRPGAWPARFLVPLGLAVEPFVSGWFTPSPRARQVDVAAHQAAGVIELGVAFVLLVTLGVALARFRRT